MAEVKHPGVRRREPGEKQAQLILAARDLFISGGYDQTTTVQIARHAGVSEGILFHHFGSKKGLFARIAEDYATELAAAMQVPAADGITITSIVRNIFAFMLEHHVLDRLIQTRGPELAEQAAFRRQEIVVGAIERLLSARIKAGQMRRGDPHIMAELQYGFVDGAVRAWQHSQNAEVEDYIVETIKSMEAINQIESTSL